MLEIIPAIIPQNLSVVREKLSPIIGSAKKIQLDIVDGQYAKSVTWPFNGNQFEEMIKMVRGEEKFPFVDNFIIEIDLLVMHPIEYLSDFMSIGAKSFVIHIDSTDHVKECVSAIKYANCTVGLGIKPSLDTSLLYPFLPEIDFVQFMGNDRVGYNGVELDEAVLDKIRDFHSKHSGMPIQIDIGVNKKTIPLLEKAGASSFVSGSEIFNTSSSVEAIKILQAL
jgi:ribulose-phosphate 3-epimerase